MSAESTRDLPQASSLPTVRAFVAAVAAGKNESVQKAGVASGLSKRHAGYYGIAAIVTLGLVEQSDRLRVTNLGAELLATPTGSLAERDVFRRAITDSVSITSIAHDLLAPEGPTAEALAHRLLHAGLSEATAKRRASTLLTWRRYVLERQSQLPMPLAKVVPIATADRKQAK